MKAPDVDREALRAAAHRQYRPGISKRQAIILGYADLVGAPLDPEARDDDAILVRAERLLLKDVGVEEALRVAREERVTWSTPDAAREDSP